MTTTVKPGKKMVWFTVEQAKVLEELSELTGLGHSQVIRKAMDLLLVELKGK